MKDQRRGKSANRWGGEGKSYPPEIRKRVVKEVVEHGATYVSVARIFGIAATTIQEWVKRYREQGWAGLEPKAVGAPSHKNQPGRKAKREAVKEAKQEHPEWGARRIQHVLARFEALGVSATDIRRILHEEGLLDEAPPPVKREHPPRRFERAAPNQLWQSDIFTFLLRRHTRVYVTVFMDDHSRFVVSHVIAHHQRSMLVMEALERGIASYGTPQEILTDQGRQYTTWRGETEFEQALRRYGIRHVKSRPQHPQTLGKVERFWKTLWDEFLSRTVFADFADCERRLALFIQAYNFQRPHQALEGLVPADRFFRAAPQVRAAIERNVADNAMRMAHEQPTRKPFYLVGRLGDRDLSIAAAGGGLSVQMGDEKPQTIELPKGDDDEQAQVSRFDEEAPSSHDTEVAEEAGARRSGAEPLPDAPERAERGEAGDRCARGVSALAGAVLPARDAGAASDAARDATRREWRDLCNGPGERAREEGGDTGAGEAADRAAADSDEAGGEGEPGEGAPLTAELDEAWEETFAEIEEVGTDERDAAGEREFDADDGWRGRALRWERKLAGADETRDGAMDGEEDLYADTRGARGDGERGGAASRPLTQSLSDADARGPGWNDQGPDAEASGTAGEAAARSGARSGSGPAPAGERATAESGGHDRPAAGSGERRAPGPNSAGAGAEDGEDDEDRGPR
jgi:transposase InsO family protein